MEDETFTLDGIPHRLSFERADGEWLAHAHRNGRRVGCVMRLSESIVASPDAARMILTDGAKAIIASLQWQGAAAAARPVPFTHEGISYEIWPESRNYASGATVYRDGTLIASTDDVPWPDKVGGPEEDAEAIERARWLVMSGFRGPGRGQ
ncbi:MULTISPECIES: hypothetical protein [Methylorubrum]|uniref:hypothetical protein n=1 Tax=Methylorubrum TaxID=2282523 RepID=UPI00209D8BA5|nr:MULTISPECIES: hypothetical protein [Methylorubrum]MCP1551668.1 hypothetical protein [Methylorubrum zatmanii]MCP1556596.1 hypothetical protein [Methylorubrum extorquens]MCP1582003.1 hypothetical protein [Methylorubrum extorquens]